MRGDCVLISVYKLRLDRILDILTGLNRLTGPKLKEVGERSLDSGLHGFGGIFTFGPYHIAEGVNHIVIHNSS